MAPIDSYKGFFFDMDGVLYLGSSEIPGAAATLKFLRQHNKHVAVVTNNSGQSADAIARRLEKLGFPADEIDVVIATRATATWMAETRPGGTAFVLGAAGLKQEITQAGIEVREDPCSQGYDCDFLVVGNDGQIDYARLTQAIRVGRAGATFVAVNQDRLYPGQGGLFPGGGALVGAISHGIGREPDKLIGKPSPFLLSEAMQRAGLQPQQCIMIGDTLGIDVLMGHNAGTATALVLTGVDNRETLSRSPVQPTFVMDSVADLTNMLNLAASLQENVKPARNPA